MREQIIFIPVQYSIVWNYFVLIHSIRGPLGCFQLPPPGTNNASMNILVFVFPGILAQAFL